MDSLDRQLLNVIQADFPIAERPYAEIGKRLGISEDDSLERVRSLVRSGLIRRIGPSFDTRKLGHTSILVAAKVLPGKLVKAAEIVSTFPQVTHNYGRDHEYNLWFTLICRDASEIEQVLDEIKTRTGISDMHMLPAERLFKIRVEFEL